MPSFWTVTAASEPQWPAACAALARTRPPAQQLAQAHLFLTTLATGGFDPAGLFVAVDCHGRVIGAMLGQALDGAVGIVWPPGVETHIERAALEDDLVGALGAWQRSRGVKVSQCLPQAGDREGLPALERHGYRNITRLALWRRRLEDGPAPDPSPRGLEFTPTGDTGELRRTLLATYEGSRDCPESAGDRTAEELIAGHGAPPAGEPFWFLARHGGEPVGVVLLAPGEQLGSAELTYLGLTPPARGRGWGHELAAFALRHSVARGFHNLTLSVDVRNAPAVQLYRRQGFRPYDWRDVYNVVWPQKR